MLKEFKYLIFLIVIFFFIFFTLRYYFSDQNKKNSYTSFNQIDKKIEKSMNDLILLKNDTAVSYTHLTLPTICSV